MIIAYLAHKIIEPQEITAANQALLKEAVWIDLLSPTKEEEKLVEHCLAVEIPTSEEMREIELSSRLYQEDGVLFMTATMVAQSASFDPQHDAVTFVLTQQQLITIRYIEPLAFRLFIARLQKLDAEQRHATALFIELLDVTVDRLADILEVVGHNLDEYSRTIFRPKPMRRAKKLDYSQLMQQIGGDGDLNTKARESLVTFNRLIIFFEQTSAVKSDHQEQLRLTTLSRDISALSDHASFFSTKINFLLDATLGMVNIEQNNIIKIVSVAAVIFLPPTLIASIYGMNFKFMPELAWRGGYWLAIGLMVLAAWLPYRYFKHRKWL